MTGPVVVALGDSITLGVGDGDDASWGRAGWAAHVAHATGAPSFTNLAANGVRARDLAAQIPDALACGPDVVLATVGGNDALRGDFDPDEVAAHTRHALTSLCGERRTVMLVTIDRIGLFDLLPRPIAAVMARRAQAVNAALAWAANDTGAILVDGSVIFASVGASAWHIDRIHPSPRGHRALAQASLAHLEEWPQRHAITPAAHPPSRAARTWWLARRGIPWATRRSRDLLPQVLGVVATELRKGTTASDPRTSGPSPHTTTAG